MKIENYKSAVDSVRFRENFERDTIGLLNRNVQCEKQKEYNEMKFGKIIKVSVMITALVVVLAATAFALTALLSPKDVAKQSGFNTLAKAFDSKDAISINKSVQTGDYTITLQGIVSGKGLIEYDKEANADKTYVVASVAFTDGRKIAQAGDAEITFSPLVSGYKPWQVNAWTLSGGYSSFIYEGVNYYLFDCSNLEIFADHTVYLAAYEGGAPDAKLFAMSENGEIFFAKDYDKAKAMFTLPLDPKKADPDAVKKLVASFGVEQN